MDNKGSIARFVVVCVISVVLILYNIYLGTLGKNSFEVNYQAPAQKEESISQPTTDQEENQEKQDSTQTNTQNEATVPAATPSNAKGKIISQYISPYTAALSYDKVYMKNSTGVAVDIKSLLNASPTFKIKKDSTPQVLIIHTHTTETFMDKDTNYYTSAFTSRTRDNNKNMVSVGKIIAEKLKNAGIGVIHDTTQHDYPQYTGSYTRAAATINKYLKKYPQIKMVIDVHRDAVSSGNDKVKLVTEIGGEKAAQVMLVMGSNTGTVKNFPNWKENLKLALKLQQTIETKYPTLARPLSLTSNNYNESLTTGSILLEVGTDANAIAEAHYSATLVGDALVSMLNSVYS